MYTQILKRKKQNGKTNLKVKVKITYLYLAVHSMTLHKMTCLSKRQYWIYQMIIYLVFIKCEKYLTLIKYLTNVSTCEVSLCEIKNLELLLWI